MDPSDTRPTPPSGMPAAGAKTVRMTGDENAAPKSERTIAILEALGHLREEVRVTREESRVRGEETAHRFDRLDRKVDTLTSDDEALRLDFRRLEQRQAASDEELKVFQREIREELRRDRQERDVDKTKMADTLDAMKRHVEVATSANAESVDKAVMKLDGAARRLDYEAQRADARDAHQDRRLDTMEQFAAAVCDELGIETPSGIDRAATSSGEKRGGKLSKIAHDAEDLAKKTVDNRRVTWAAVTFAGMNVLYVIAKIIDHLITSTKGAPPSIP